MSWFLTAALPPDVSINVHVHAETNDHVQPMMAVTSEAPMMCDTDFLSDLLPSKSQASVFDSNLTLCTKASCVWKIKSSLFQMMPFITLKYREL